MHGPEAGLEVEQVQSSLFASAGSNVGWVDKLPALVFDNRRLKYGILRINIYECFFPK